MYFQWLSFQLDLVSLVAFIEPLMTGYDGLVCDTTCFCVIGLTDTGIQSQITAYMAGLTSSGESAKIAARDTANANELNTLLTTSWDSLTIAQKQLLLGISTSS